MLYLYGQTDRQTDRQTVRQTDRQTDRAGTFYLEIIVSMHACTLPILCLAFLHTNIKRETKVSLVKKVAFRVTKCEGK